MDGLIGQVGAVGIFAFLVIKELLNRLEHKKNGTSGTSMSQEIRDTREIVAQIKRDQEPVPWVDQKGDVRNIRPWQGLEQLRHSERQTDLLETQSRLLTRLAESQETLAGAQERLLECTQRVARKVKNNDTRILRLEGNDGVGRGQHSDVA